MRDHQMVSVLAGCIRRVLPTSATIWKYWRMTPSSPITRTHCCQISVRSGQHLRLEIGGDGVGMPEGWRPGGRITAMRERVAELSAEPASLPACR